MKNWKLVLKVGLLALMTIKVGKSWGQVIGDYRTKQTSVAWETASHWQTWNGTNWVTAVNPPASTNDVYIQSGHTATLGINQSCNSLFISSGTTSPTNGTDARLALAAYVLQLNGKLSSYYGTVNTTENSSSPLTITPTNTIPAQPITKTSGGKLKVVGDSRNITVSSEWGASNTGNSTTFDIEFAINAGQTVVIGGAIKAAAFTFTSGSIDFGLNRIAVDNGTEGEGNVNITSDATVLSAATGGGGSSVISRTGNASTGESGTTTIDGTLILTGSAPEIQCRTFNITGTIVYSSNSNQAWVTYSTTGATPLSTYYNVSLLGSGIKTTPISQTLTVNGKLILGGTSTISLGTSGAITYGNDAILEYAGSTSQNTTSAEFPVSSGPHFLSINNSESVNLHATRTVSTLNLMAGKLNLNGNPLTVSTISGGSSSNYIIAESPIPVIKNNPSSFTFPIGTEDYYMPCTITGSGTYSVSLGTTEIGLSDPSYALTNQWDISRSGGSGDISASFQWPTAVQGNNFPSSLYLFKNTSGTWTNAAGPVSASGGNPNTASFTNVPCCSGFVPGGEQSLPVELTYFNANQQQSSTLLTWQTASELNNSHFAIERGTDGAAYREIGEVRGNGTSLTLNNYRFVDERPAPGINYYRLRQVDFDGQFEYSRVVSVNFGEREGEVQLYPTLASDEVILVFSNPTVSNGTILLYSQNGRLVKTVDFEEETTEVRMDVSTLPSGNYYVRVHSGRLLETLRFVKR